MKVKSSELADRISANLTPILEKNKEVIIANSGNLVQRNALRLGWSMLMNIVPTVMRYGIDVTKQEFGKLNLVDLLDWLEKTKK